MNLFDYLIPFALALGLLILVHELGHYLVARWCGVKVLRFSLGFGKPLLVRKAGRDQTEWARAEITQRTAYRCICSTTSFPSRLPLAC